MGGAGYYRDPVPEVVWTVVVAAGSGRRFGAPKQYADLAGRRMLDVAVATARAAGDGVVIVVPSGDLDDERAVVADGVRCAPGGATRTESVRAGLGLVPDEATIICVHDAARPLASARLFADVIDVVRGGADAAVPAVPVTDTIKVVDPDGTVVATPDRATLVAVQTPQAFRAAVLRAAHALGGDGTDDAALVEAHGVAVSTVPGEPVNIKVTDPGDLERVRRSFDAAGAS